jgi:hypothetical protein
MIAIQSMKKKKPSNQLNNPDHKKQVLERKARLSIKQKRSYDRPKDKDVLPKNFFDPSW